MRRRARASRHRRGRPRVADRPGSPALLRYGTSPPADRLAIAHGPPLASSTRKPTTTGHSAISSAGSARPTADRPLLGRLHPPGAEPPHGRGERRARCLHAPDCAARPAVGGDLLLPVAPLGEMHGDAGGLAPSGPAPRPLRTRARPRSGCGDDCRRRAAQADAFVLALPAAESELLLGEPTPTLETSPIVSVHLQFDRQLLAPRSRPCSTVRHTGCSTADG